MWRSERAISWVVYLLPPAEGAWTWLRAVWRVGCSFSSLWALSHVSEEARFKFRMGYSWLELLELLHSVVDQVEDRSITGVGLVRVVSVPNHTYGLPRGWSSGKVFSLALQGDTDHLLG